MKRILSLFMVALMLLLLPADMLASGISGAQEEPTRVRQLDELRESNSDTYLLSDGSYECVIYAGDKYYKDDSGKYVEIDHSIVRAQSLRFGKSYAYKNAAGDANAYFAENEPRVCVEMNGSSLSFSLSGANRTSARAGEATAKRSVHEYELFGKNYISYENVLNGTDLIYEMLNGCLKEYVLLKDRSAPSEYTFIFDAPELAARKTENGTVEFINAEDEAVFELGALFAVDSNGEYTDALEYTVRETGQKGRYEITVSVSKDYLTAPERAFPVLVDPSVTISGAIGDSYVSSKYPTSKYHNSNILCTGKDTNYGIRRTCIEFNLNSITNPYRIISSATFRIKKASGNDATRVYCYPIKGFWRASNLTWNNQPETYHEAVNIQLQADSNNWYKANIPVYWIHRWMTNDCPNRGLMLKEYNDTNTTRWTNYYSSESQDNKPELVVYYKSPQPKLYMYNYVDNGFLKRFPNGENDVKQYSQKVEERLERVFDINVQVRSKVEVYESYCDECKKALYGTNWNSSHLYVAAYAHGCPHTEKHTSVNPAAGSSAANSTKGFYFDFVRKKEVGTETLTKYLWTGHIPAKDGNGKDERSFSVRYYTFHTNSGDVSELHNIVFMSPIGVTDPKNQYATVTNANDISYYKKRYPNVMLHETGHQLGCYDHYCPKNETANCGSANCWLHGQHLTYPPSCIMYDTTKQLATDWFCPVCKYKILEHLKNH